MNPMTGLPEPYVATHAVEFQRTPRSSVNPFFSRMPVTYLEVSTSWNPNSAIAEDLVDHLLHQLLPLFDLRERFLF